MNTLYSKLHKIAGYTHIVRYTELLPYGIAVEKSFPTSSDAVEIHKKSLQGRKEAGIVIEYVIEEIL